MASSLSPTVEGLARECIHQMPAWGPASVADFMEYLAPLIQRCLTAEQELARFNAAEVITRVQEVNRNLRMLLTEAEQERDEARKALAEHACKLPKSIQNAMNSGDGTYRP